MRANKPIHRLDQAPTLIPGFKSAVCSLTLLVLALLAVEGRAQQAEARRILDATGVEGGLVVHLGCGDGRLTAAFCLNDSFMVHGLDTDAAKIMQAREFAKSTGRYGKVSIDHWDGQTLPYIDNLVNLVVAENPVKVPISEILRVLCPQGVAYLRQDGQWTKTVKPRPAEMDEWTHYLHDAGNNAVAHDTLVGPPRRLQWVGSPLFARHHDRMSSVSAVVTAGGRVFYIFDEASRISILVPPQWKVIARDAFNGTILWKRPIEKWHTHLWPLKSGPAQLPRRLVASGDRVYVTLSLNGPTVALDAATGKTTRVYEETAATEEILLSDGVLFLLVNQAASDPDYADLSRINKAYGGKFWDEAPRRVMAVRADTGQVLWNLEQRVLPATLAADSQGVFLHDGESVVRLDRASGRTAWRSEPVPRCEQIMSFYVPTLLVHDDVVLFSGGETAGKQTGSWYTSGEDTMTALDAGTGKKLWSAYHPPSGYRSPEDLLVVNGLVWTGETTSGRVKGVFTGRDLHSGEVKVEFAPEVDTYWFHHRCYRGKATDNYLLMARTGTEFIDVRQQTWQINHWVRGACLYGVMPANGLLYAPQNPCACYLESKLAGFNAVAPARSSPPPKAPSNDQRLERGPAYDEVLKLEVEAHAEDWPTYRHDLARSGHATTPVPERLQSAWDFNLGGRLSSPVVADNKVFVASVDAHTVHAFNASSGKSLWHFTAGGRVDSPPTWWQGRILFGSADGWVYCLRAADGALAWRFLAARSDQRLMSFEQLESVWPVPGNILVRDGIACLVAGRSMFLDGGMRLWRLDARTGQVLSETVLDNRDAETGKDLQSYVSWLNMPTAMPDILSSSGPFVYMRGQPFRLDGTRLPLKPFPRGADADSGAPAAVHDPEHAHLFSPTGFLDDTGWHRSYWLYGSMFVSGWSGYYRSGKTAPAGRLLVFDDSKVYGYGRKPQYFRWTTPMENHLWTADKLGSASVSEPAPDQKLTRVRIPNSASLNPGGKPLTVAAWVKAEKPGGVVFAHGGASFGYALFLEQGRPVFAIRNNQELATATADQKIVGKWVHLTGILAAEKGLQIFVDGKLAGAAKVPGLIDKQPADSAEIGADENSGVGNYTGEFPFTGIVDELRIWHQALSAAEIAQLAAAAQPPSAADGTLVLAYSFEAGDATDASGKNHHGTMTGAERTDGKVGKGLRFLGGTANSGDPGNRFQVAHHWSKELPIYVRAMVLARGTIFAAGPADLLDEEQAFKRISDPGTKPDLERQATSLEGRQGATLWAISATDGEKVLELPLPAPPVFDGLAAARGRLFLATVDGRIIALAAAP